jgi:hypothetical protein
MPDTESELNSRIASYGIDEVKLVRKSNTLDGFTVVEGEPVDPNTSRFISDTKKIIFDNSAPYGHILTMWLYMLLSELSRIKEPVTIFFYLKPDTPHMRLEHSSNLTNYLYERFTQKGHKIEYLNVRDFYMNNFINITTPAHKHPNQMQIVSEFLSEGLDYSEAPTKKLYISRGKTTTYNGNKQNPIPNQLQLQKDELEQIRDINTYTFSDRIDDEKTLEDYLKTLGFIIYYPEDNESYKDQLQLFASSKIVMSITSSSLSICSVMAPNTLMVEISTPLCTEVDSQGRLLKDSAVFHDIYKNISTLKNRLYLAISNNDKEAAKVIESIESNLALKALLSS